MRLEGTQMLALLHIKKREAVPLSILLHLEYWTTKNKDNKKWEAKTNNP